MSTTTARPGPTPPCSRSLIYAGPKRLTQIMGGGLLAMVAFFFWMLIDSAGKPQSPGQEPSVAVAIVSLSIATAVFMLGLLLVFGWSEVIIDPAQRRVTHRFHWFMWRRQRSYALDEFTAVGIGLCWQQSGGTQRPFYFVRLVSRSDLWIPGGGSQEAAERQAIELANATGLGTVLEPHPARFFPVFG